MINSLCQPAEYVTLTNPFGQTGVDGCGVEITSFEFHIRFLYFFATTGIGLYFGFSLLLPRTCFTNFGVVGGSQAQSNWHYVHCHYQADCWQIEMPKYTRSHRETTTQYNGKCLLFRYLSISSTGNVWWAPHYISSEDGYDHDMMSSQPFIDGINSLRMTWAWKDNHLSMGCWMLMTITIKWTFESVEKQEERTHTQFPTHSFPRTETYIGSIAFSTGSPRSLSREDVEEVCVKGFWQQPLSYLLYLRIGGGWKLHRVEYLLMMVPRDEIEAYLYSLVGPPRFVAVVIFLMKV